MHIPKNSVAYVVALCCWKTRKHGNSMNLHCAPKGTKCRESITNCKYRLVNSAYIIHGCLPAGTDPGHLTPLWSGAGSCRNIPFAWDAKYSQPVRESRSKIFIKTLASKAAALCFIGKSLRDWMSTPKQNLEQLWQLDIAPLTDSQTPALLAKLLLGFIGYTSIAPRHREGLLCYKWKNKKKQKTRPPVMWCFESR